MTARKYVLVLTSTFPRWQGDTEPPFVHELSRHLADRYEVLVLAPHASGAQHKERMGKLEISRFQYFFTAWQSLAYQGGILANLKKNRLRFLLIPLFLLSELVSLVSLLRKHKVDLIHAHWTIPQGLIAVVARALVAKNKPAVLCTSHGTDLLGLNGMVAERVQKFVIAEVDKLTVVSAALHSRALSLVDRGDIGIIPMGVDLTEVFTPPEISSRRRNEILFVGRLVRQKGVNYLIQAMPDILKQHADAVLSIVGDGPEREALQRLARVLGVGERVRFIGAVENSALNQYYRKATMLVSPSLSEGFGLTLVEALGCACPVVATELPATREIVVNGVTGLICKQKDSMDLVAKICSLLECPEVGEKIGINGRQHVLSRFDWKIISDQYAVVVDRLLEARG